MKGTQEVIGLELKKFKINNNWDITNHQLADLINGEQRHLIDLKILI